LGVRVHRCTGLAKHGMRGDGGPTTHQRGWDGVTALTSRRGGPRFSCQKKFEFMGKGGGGFADDSGIHDSNVRSGRLGETSIGLDKAPHPLGPRKDAALAN
jgi:hypothetical protein